MRFDAAVTLQLSVARVLFSAGKHRDAEAIAQDTLELDGRAVPALHLLSRVCHVDGRLTETIEHWRRARLADPPRPAPTPRTSFDPLAWPRMPPPLSVDRDLDARLYHRSSAPEEPVDWLQEPSASDVVRALRVRYVPLDTVPQVRFVDDERAELELELRGSCGLIDRYRARAFIAFVEGDCALCERMLRRVARSRSGSWRDFAALADLARLQSRDDEAFELDLEAARRAPSPEPGVWRRLARAVRRGADAAKIRALLSEPERSDAVLGVMLEEARTHPGNRKAWAALATLEHLAGRTDAARTHRQKAAAIASASRALHEPGRVLVAAVYALEGEPRGLVHEMHATRARIPKGAAFAPGLAVLGNVTPELFALAHRVLANVRCFVRAWWPHLGADADDFLYTLRVTKDDEPSSGSSAGLPLAIAFLSLLTGRPVPDGVAFSGAISCDSDAHLRVRRVGDADVKVQGALHRRLSAVVLPAENRSDVERSDRVPQQRAREVTRYVSTLHEGVELLWGRSAWDW